IYQRRNEILDGDDLEEQAEAWIHDVVEGGVLEFANSEVQPEEWDLEGLVNTLRTIYPTALTPGSFEMENLTPEELIERFSDESLEVYDRRADEIGEEEFRKIERQVLLNVLDAKWREHLY